MGICNNMVPSCPFASVFAFSTAPVQIFLFCLDHFLYSGTPGNWGTFLRSFYPVTTSHEIAPHSNCMAHASLLVCCFEQTDVAGFGVRALRRTLWDRFALVLRGTYQGLFRAE